MHQQAQQQSQLKEAMATEMLTGKPVGYKEANLSPKFARLTIQRQELKGEIKELETFCDGLSESLLTDLASSGFKGVMVDSFHVQIIDQTRTSLSKEKLLEAGVSAQTIADCMVESPSTYLKVTDTDKGKVTRKEKKSGVTSIQRKAKGNGNGKSKGRR